MRFATCLATLALLALLAPGLTSVASARDVAPEQDLDRSMSPYFVVKGEGKAVDGLPLKATGADVHIAGTIAHVKVTQTYENAGDAPIEAVYVFPGSSRSAVFAMKMTIGDRTIIAEINEKEEARKIYEAAKAAGKSASLLEQQRPNVFQMNVANIMPGDRITVEMDYTELLVPTEGTYEFVYPAVVGPRFTGEDDGSDTKPDVNGGLWTAVGYTGAGVGAAYTWDVAVSLDGGMPIKRVTSTSHPIAADFSDARKVARVALTNKGAAGTKDFVLQYQLAGKAIQSGLLLFPGEKESFFLAMVQPPETVTKRDMPKREYIFILDVSGSMHGFPLDTAKQVMKGLFKGLTPQDRFNIMYFSGGSAMLSEKSLPATKANIQRATTETLSRRGGGGTRILSALDRALALPTPDDFARTFVVVTDGYVSVEPAVFEKIRDNLGQASLFAFGIGSSINRHLIDGMARVGMGEPFFVMHGDDAAEKAAKFEKYISAPALTNIDVKYTGFDAYDIEPTSVPDLFASRPVMIFGKYRGTPTGKITLTGTSGAGRYEQVLKVADYAPDKANKALRYLWARHRVAALADLNRMRKDDARVKEVTRLGLEYSLMTQYTSFVAVDSQVRNKTGDAQTVKQPLPLPDGVSNLAVGGSLGLSGSGSGGGGYALPPASAPGRGYRSKKLSMPMVRRPESKPSPSPVTAAADAPAPAEQPEAEEQAEARKDTARGPRAQLHSTSVTGALSKSQVLTTLRRQQRHLDPCVAGLSASAGRVQLQLVIDASGRVLQAQILSDGLSAQASGCLLAKLKKLRFTAASGKTTITLSIGMNGTT